MLDWPPYAPLFVAALLVPFLRGWARSAVLVAAPVLGAVALFAAPEGVHWQVELLGYTLSPYRMDRLSRLFGLVFLIAAFMGNLFALHLREGERATLQHVAALVHAGSGVAAVFAGDLISLFVFWELLPLSSVFLIWARKDEQEKALATGLRYLIVNVVSGVLLLAGALVHVQASGSLEFGFIGLEGLAGWLILSAFAVKAAFPLLHNWLTDAYPEATVTGAVFLSAYSTKTAVYALARGYPGTELLIVVGAVMTCFPIFYAVLENDLRRVLAYSLVNQVGFMVTGIGIGTELALNGAVAHAFAHIIYKGLLFMSMGAVLKMAGTVKGSELGGLYKTMPLTATFCAIGAASISAFPFFSGFVAKSMVMTAALEGGHTLVWLALLYASAGVFHHAGIKVPYFAFFGHDSGIRAKEPPVNMLLAMGIGAALCIGIGIFPGPLYELLPWTVDYHPYDATHVLTQFQLLFFAALAFAYLKLSGIYPPELRSVNLDAEWVYRRLAPRFVGGAAARIRAVDGALRLAAVNTVKRAFAGVFRAHGPHGPLARDWPTGSMVLWTAILLAAFLAFRFF